MLADATVLGGKASSIVASMLPALGSENRLLAGDPGKPGVPAGASAGAAIPVTGTAGSALGWVAAAAVELRPVPAPRLGIPSLTVQRSTIASGKTFSFRQDARTFSACTCMQSCEAGRLLQHMAVPNLCIGSSST